MRRAVVVAIAFAVALLGAGCLKTSAPPPSSPPQSGGALDGLPFQKLEDAVSSIDAPIPAPNDVSAPEDMPNVQTGETASASQNVIVSSIVKNQMLPNPFVILGRARAFENTIAWRVRDARGKVLVQGTAMTNAPDIGLFGRFRIRAFFNGVPETSQGTVEVFTWSPANGIEQDMVVIPVAFETSVVPIKVFFSNIKNDLQTLDCGKVYAATRRVPLTENVAEAAILELLKGPTAAEQTQGFRTSVFPGTVLRSINLKEGTITVDFSKEFLYAVAGSCHVQALIQQIEQTLKQYPSVLNVKIFVEGEDASDKLQP